MSGADLLPCPFCGGEALEHMDGPYFVVSCIICGGEQAKELRRVARSAWNRRASALARCRCLGADDNCGCQGLQEIQRLGQEWDAARAEEGSP